MPKTIIVKKQTRLASVPKKYRKSFQNWNTKSERFWSEEDSQFLRDNYKSLSAKELSNKLGRSVSSIRSRAFMEGLSNKRGVSTIPKIAKEITLNSVKGRVSWSRKEISLLRKEFKEIGVAEMAKKLGRSAGSVSGKAHALGLTKKRTSGRSYKNWTESELSFLEDNINKKSTSTIAKKLKRTSSSVTSKIQTLKSNKKAQADKIDSSATIATEQSSNRKKSMSKWIVGSLILSNVATIAFLTYLLLV